MLLGELFKCLSGHWPAHDAFKQQEGLPPVVWRSPEGSFYLLPVLAFVIILDLVFRTFRLRLRAFFDFLFGRSDFRKLRRL